MNIKINKTSSKLLSWTLPVLLFCALFFIASISTSYAQNESVQAENTDSTNTPETDGLKDQEKKPQSSQPRSIESIPSLFFTYWQERAIKDAQNSKGYVNAPTDSELRGGKDKKVEPGEREIRLGGIVFTDSKDWTIWLNEQRITPRAIPKEVLDLQVYKEYIELKWLDEYTNQIFPIRLRSHQRFNLDSRIFIPG